MAMSNNLSEIETFVQGLFNSTSLRKGGLTEVEKLVMASIVDQMSYRQAAIEYKYTESSFQNSAARLFKDLGTILGFNISRRSFLAAIADAKQTKLATVAAKEITFDRLQANIWVRSDKAQLVSISYQAEQVLDLTEYLVQYSPKFGATFCLDMTDQSSPLELLWKLCHLLQVALPKPHNNINALLKSIGLALKKRATLLIFRFDRGAVEPLHRSSYVQILAVLGMLEHLGCLLVFDNDVIGPEPDLVRSWAGRLRSEIDRPTLLLDKSKKPETRLISIDNDQAVICDLLQRYIT
jgi:hypothetical protein